MATSSVAGRPAVSTGWAVSDRPDDSASLLAAILREVLVLRTDVTGDPSFRGMLGRVRTFDLEAYDHQDIPF